MCSLLLAILVLRCTSQDESDDYKDDGGEDYEDDDNVMFDDDDLAGRRRSQRVTTKNGNGKRGADSLYDWRSERRSTRINTTYDDEGPSKRARTSERSTSSAPSESQDSPDTQSNGTAKVNGASNVKQNEVAVEQVAGKKKSKFWYYAVEPSAGQAVAPVTETTNGIPGVNGHTENAKRTEHALGDVDRQVNGANVSLANGSQGNGNNTAVNGSGTMVLAKVEAGA
jgi:hypothetical protein